MEAFHLCSLKRARLTPLLSSANCPSWPSLQKAVLAHPGTEGGVKPHQLGKLGRPSQASESLSFPVLFLVRYFLISFSVFSICFCCCCSFCFFCFCFEFCHFCSLLSLTAIQRGHNEKVIRVKVYESLPPPLVAV